MMTRWEKLSQALLRIADEMRQQRGAVMHLSSHFGRATDVLERVEKRLDETHASHQKTIRQYTELEARVARQERARGGR